MSKKTVEKIRLRKTAFFVWFWPVKTAFLLAFTSGLFMGLTPAPAHLWPLAWVTLAPLWILTHPTAHSHALRTKLLLGFTWGIGYHGLTLSWISGLHPLTWLGVPWLASVAITLFAWVFITLWGAASVALWVGLFAGIGSWVRGRAAVRDRQTEIRGQGLGLSADAAGIPQSAILQPWEILSQVLLGTALWCAIEALRNYGPLDWTPLAFTQSPYNLPILHLGQLAGPQLVTGAIVLVNGLLAETWLQFKTQNFKPLLTISLLTLIGFHLIGLSLYSQPLVETEQATLKVGIVQGNVPTRIKHAEDGVQLAYEHYTSGYQALVDQGVEAVLTPEGTFPWLWVGTPRQSRNPLYQAIRDRGIPAWIGTVGWQQGQITQSLFTITGRGEIFSRYDKVKLVPLGEYMPLASVLGGLINRLSPVDATLVPGQLDQQFETPFGQAIVGICFDSAFPNLFRHQAATGGQFILTASNNDPYNATMMAQHHAQDVMRAIETDRWAVRATNTGFSGIVDPHGYTHWLSGFRTYETHAHTIYRRQTQTLYVRFGDWFTPLLTIAALAIGWGLRSWGLRIRS